MNLVMTLLVRDEADIIDEHISFHLAAGVDFVVAMDHKSTDGTTDVLEKYARQKVLRLLRTTEPEKKQPAWVTGMARMAAVEYRADWVINSDADEFWWPRGGTLKEVLAAIPREVGIVTSVVQTFLPQSGAGSFAERLTVRLTPLAPINDPSGSFRASTRLLHRGAPDVVVGTGNASVRSDQLSPLRTWSPVEVLHFPIRSYAQFERKFRTKHVTADEDELLRFDTWRLRGAADTGQLEARFADICPDEAGLQCGVSRGVLAVDVRLRDALRELTAGARTLRFPRATGHEIAYAAERSVQQAAELVRLTRRVDELRSAIELR